MARREPAAALGTMRVEIHRVDLRGRSCGPAPGGGWYDQILVGLARGSDSVDLVDGDAPSADWAFDVQVRAAEGSYDFGGPFVLGHRGERYVGLRWFRTLPGGGREVFRGAKFRLWEMDRDLVRRAIEPHRRLIGRLGLTDDQGWPRCATVRPPTIAWSVE